MQFSIRLSNMEYEALRVHCYATDRKMNDVIRHAICEFLVTSDRDGEVTALISTARKQYRAALDKLAAEGEG